MHHRRFHRRRPPLGARFYASENVLERLDEYQRDLEQELADVTELIKRLRADEARQGEDPRRSRRSMSRGGFSLALRVLDHLLGHMRRHFLVAEEVHRVVAAAAGDRGQRLRRR